MIIELLTKKTSLII